MYVQQSVILDAKAMTLNATHPEDMQRSGLLLRLHLLLSSDQVSGLGQTGGDWRLVDKISDVQLIGNGQRVIQALNAKEHQYRGYAGGHKVTIDTWRNYASNTQFCKVPILFGRRWLDPEMALNLANWSQVQLKVTNTATSSHFSTAIAMTVIASYLRDPVGGMGQRGYIKAEAQADWVPVAADTKGIDLPTQGRLHQLLLHLRPGVNGSNVANTSYTNLADLITLKTRGRTLPIMEHSASRLADENWYDLDGELITMGNVYINADAGFDVGIGRVVGRAGISVAKDGAASGTLPTTSDNNDHTQVNETYEGDSPIGQWWRGQGYHNILSLPVAWGMDPSQWLDLAAERQVTLDVRTRSTATVTSAKNRVLTSILHTGVDQVA